MKFNDKHFELMRSLGLNFNFSNLSDDEYCEIEERVGDELVLHCLDENYEPNERGLICEEILWNLEDN